MLPFWQADGAGHGMDMAAGAAFAGGGAVDDRYASDSAAVKHTSAVSYPAWAPDHLYAKLLYSSVPGYKSICSLQNTCSWRRLKSATRIQHFLS